MDSVDATCREAIDTLETRFADFLELVGGTAEGFYHHLLGLENPLLWRGEYTILTALIQLGRVQEALDRLCIPGADKRELAEVFYGRTSGECFRDYCRNVLNLPIGKEKN